MKFATALISLLTILPVIDAHTIFQQLKINGVAPGLGVGIRLPSKDGPIWNVSSPDMTCNGGRNPIVSHSPIVLPLSGGDIIDIQFKPGIDQSHRGPVSVYMAKVPNALTETPTEGWFKIWEKGVVKNDTAKGGVWWAVDELRANNGWVYGIEVPRCLEAGEYLFRGEMLALHDGAYVEGAQFYMSCAQFRVGGVTGDAHPATVSVPGYVKYDDPGVLHIDDKHHPLHDFENRDSHNGKNYCHYNPCFVPHTDDHR
ncbi:hypothetical protein HK097_008659 [Rhizophlyctis rosea]|uniref:AA9 family lytic polysaccharide monooxygenase n=1 Tax=Rhizophlyctis rosea TaxID=64517 RepID=A0AAD5X8E8_9FUNG|nr:hypothetical protein HK097_008659 [Rhizophlyctis rosea]